MNWSIDFHSLFHSVIDRTQQNISKKKLCLTNLLDWSNSKTFGSIAGIISLLINLQTTVRAKQTSKTLVLQRSW